MLDEVQARDNHVVEAACKEPFDLLFLSPKFRIRRRVGRPGLEPGALRLKGAYSAIELAARDYTRSFRRAVAQQQRC